MLEYLCMKRYNRYLVLKGFRNSAIKCTIQNSILHRTPLYLHYLYDDGYWFAAHRRLISCAEPLVAISSVKGVAQALSYSLRQYIVTRRRCRPAVVSLPLSSFRGKSELSDEGMEVS
jgi:hypothetical protein